MTTNMTTTTTTPTTPQFSLKSILLNYCLSKKTNNNISMINLMCLLKPLNNITYKDDIKILIDDTLTKTTDVIQQKTLLRFLNYKPAKPAKLNKISDIQPNTPTLSKECPHCSHIYTTNDTTTTYVICGYGSKANSGYDWIGCQRDWCFSCGKKLCKKWDENMLNVIENRTHNHKCCKKDAKKGAYPQDYMQNYCQCSGYNVNRNKVAKTI